MSKLTKLQKKLQNGQYNNWSFSDFRYVLEKTGWTLNRIAGSHHIFTNPKYEQIINIQNKSGKAKEYQIKQFLEITKEK